MTHGFLWKCVLPARYRTIKNGKYLTKQMNKLVCTLFLSLWLQTCTLFIAVVVVVVHLVGF